MAYARDYSVIEIKKLLKEAEQYGGHGLSKHHDISDDDARYFHKSAFRINATTNLTRTETYSVRRGRRRIQQTRNVALYQRTVSDQPFMVAAILNTSFGQAALGLLDRYWNSRIVIHAWPESMGMMPAMRMRAPSPHGMVENGIGRVVMVIEGGYAKLHFVTAYPTVGTSYFFKFGPPNLKNFAQSFPGAEQTWSNGHRKALWQWSSHNQSSGQLLWKW